MNHVNLIGKISSTPKFMELEDGKKVAKFTMSTKEVYLDAEGKAKTRNNWHTISAWGRWVKVMEEFGLVGIEMAVEGKLVSRFYSANGQRKFVAEVEANDIILI